MAHSTDLNEFRKQWQHYQPSFSHFCFMEKGLRGTTMEFRYFFLHFSAEPSSFQVLPQKPGQEGWQVERESSGKLLHKPYDTLTLGMGQRKLVLRIPAKTRLELL